MPTSNLINLALTFVALSFVHVIQAGGGGGSSYMKKGKEVASREQHSIYIPLVEYLFEPYVALAMPVCKKDQKMVVNLDTWLYQLFDLDEPTQMLTIDVWLEMSWNDCGLSWNPANYSNIKQITVPAGTIWHPDIIYYEALHGNFEEGVFLFGQSQARVRYDGRVQLGTQALLKSFCRIKIGEFPYDSQACNLTFASWNKDASVFELKKRDHDDKNNKFGHSFKDSSNGEWEVIGFPSFNGVKQYQVGADEGQSLTYTEVTFQLRLKRKPTYIKVYLIFPCVLLVWVAAIVFVLPVECGEKIGLSVTVLLSLIVFLLLVADNIPRVSDGIPILGYFYTLSIGLVCLSVLMTAIVLNVGLKTQEIAMPAWIKRLMRHSCCHIFCFRYHENRPSHTWVSFKMKKSNSKAPQNGGESEKHVKHDETGEQITMLPSPSKKDACAPGTCDKNDWRYLALLLDRIFMLIYVILAFIITVTIYSLEDTSTPMQAH